MMTVPMPVIVSMRMPVGMTVIVLMVMLVVMAVLVIVIVVRMVVHRVVQTERLRRRRRYHQRLSNRLAAHKKGRVSPAFLYKPYKTLAYCVANGTINPIGKPVDVPQVLALGSAKPLTMELVQLFTMVTNSESCTVRASGGMRMPGVTELTR